jgi:hypothetical protein
MTRVALLVRANDPQKLQVFQDHLFSLQQLGALLARIAGVLSRGPVAEMLPHWNVPGGLRSERL